MHFQSLKRKKEKMRKHLNDNEKIEFKYLIELVSSSVNGTAPPIPYEDKMAVDKNACKLLQC